jgi:hypothetical protein
VGDDLEELADRLAKKVATRPSTFPFSPFSFSSLFFPLSHSASKLEGAFWFEFEASWRPLVAA